MSGNTITSVRLTPTNRTAPSRFGMGMVGSLESGIIFGGRNNSRNLSNNFFKYEVSGSDVTVTRLTIVGSISARDNMGMVGDASSGIIFGGSGSTSRVDTLNDFYKYEVSGSDVTVTRLAVSGSIPERHSFGMVGDASNSVIFGGEGKDISYFNDFHLLNCAPQVVTNRLFLGASPSSQPITKIYVGSKPVTKIYLGSQQIWPASVPSEADRLLLDDDSRLLLDDDDTLALT